MLPVHTTGVDVLIRYNGNYVTMTAVQAQAQGNYK